MAIPRLAALARNDTTALDGMSGVAIYTPEYIAASAPVFMPSVVRQSLLRLLASAWTVTIAWPDVGLAQTVDASILGSVRDTAGTALTNAVVAARNTATGVEWTVTTTSTGRFAFLQLPLGGPYTITVRRIGFRPAMRSGYE